MILRNEIKMFMINDYGQVTMTHMYDFLRISIEIGIKLRKSKTLAISILPNFYEEIPFDILIQVISKINYFVIFILFINKLIISLQTR